MDKEFLDWLENERDEALDLSLSNPLASQARHVFWMEQHAMLSAAAEEIKATMYEEATGK